MVNYVKKYTSHFLGFTIIDGVLWGLIHCYSNVIFLKLLFDIVQKELNFIKVIYLVSFSALFLVLAYFYHEWYVQIKTPNSTQEIHKNMQLQLFEKAKSLDISYYDDPEFYTDFVWAINESDNRAMAICNDLGKLITRLISSVVLIGLLIDINIYVLLLIIIFIVASLLLKNVRMSIFFQKDLEAKPYQRHISYIGRVFYLSDYAKEIRLSNISKVLFREFRNSILQLKHIIKKYCYKLLAITLIQQVLTTVIFYIGIVLLLYLIAAKDNISIGDFVAAVVAANKLLSQMNDIFAFVPKFKQHSAYAEKFKIFNEYVSNLKDGDIVETGVFESLEFQEVSFCYPGSSKKVLDKLSFVINAKQKLAIVGCNGTGKSTIIKLILRLYDPISGKILLNGRDIREYKLHTYRKMINVIFQDFQLYAADLSQNVLMDVFTQGDEDLIISALSNVDFLQRLSEMPNGIKTMLTKEFCNEGLNLSGGESQKVALSRLFVKDNSLLVLDEPSSALDPISDSNFSKFVMNTTDTSIIISHRLSTICSADMILVINNGKIVERGTHPELIMQKGQYSDMFKNQAYKYQNDYN